MNISDFVNVSLYVLHSVVNTILCQKITGGRERGREIEREREGRDRMRKKEVLTERGREPLPIDAILSRRSFFLAMRLTVASSCVTLCTGSPLTSVLTAATRSARVPLATIFFTQSSLDFSEPDFPDNNYLRQSIAVLRF